MHRGKSLILAIVIGASLAYADDTKSPRDSFQEFRKGLLASYSSYRHDILKDYAKFLEEAWTEYDILRGEKRDSAPKPDVAPIAPALDDSELPAELPSPAPPQPTEPEAKLPPIDATPEVVVNIAAKPYQFDFYGIPMSVADVDLHIADRHDTSAEYAQQWRELSGTDAAGAIVKELSALVAKHNFNGYLTFDLVRHYVNARYESRHSTSRTSLMHYLLANMGYDVRLAATDSGQGALLLPFTGKVYGIPYMTIDNTRYHVFADDPIAPEARIFTCKLPEAAAKGSALELRLNPLEIPVDEKPFDFSYGDLHLTGHVNANLFPIIYHYPQMSIGDYAQSIIDPELRQSIVNQVKEQLGQWQTVDAVNRLLQFTQSAFAYATDEQAHGFEKPYFFEEMLFYPQCDCEDRVIFYTYLLWNALGVENQLITYPGHESAAVILPEAIDGDSYKHRGATFYISDPTYIGAVTGQCMPNYRINKPEIEYHYK